jgi:outer membrane receptor for ferrienterochelin and colicins
MFRKLSAAVAAVLVSALALPVQPALAASPPAANATSSDDALQEVLVTGRRDFRPGALNSEVVKTEVFDAAQIERVNAQNINQAIDFNPGISVQTECSICNVRNITLNNLPGRFTTLMIDGVPLFSSLSSAYGLDSVNVRGLERIEVARGAGASLIAPEALAGVVNIVTKRPTGPEADVTTQLGNQGSQIASAYLGNSLTDVWSGSLTASYNRHDSLDQDGNAVTEYTGYRRTLAGAALFGEFSNGAKARLRADYVHENRGGGVLGSDYAAIKTNRSGNPFDWSAGPKGSSSNDGWFAPDGSGFIPYNEGRGGFSEIIFTRRASIIGTIEGPAQEGLQWRAAFGYAHNKQDSFYELATYDGRGDQLYSELLAHYRTGSTIITGGLNYRTEKLTSRSDTADGASNDGIDDYSYRTPGVFAQYYNTFFDKVLEANASVRFDHHNVFGNIWSPRANLLWHHTDTVSSFFSAGRGFRAPTSFFEQDHGILNTSRIVRKIDKPEISDNLSYALNYSDDRLSATLSYNYNRIKNFALLDPDATDTSGDSITLFTSSPKPVTIQGLDSTVSYKVMPGIAATVGGEVFHYQFTPGTLAFSRPDWKLYASADWERSGWDVFARVTVTGPQDLAKFYDYAGNQQYNLNGTPMLNTSPTFATVDLKASYAFNGNWKFTAGIDNLFDYTQTKKEGPLWLDSTGGIDVTHIWGPLQRRYVYAGVQLSL